MKPVSTFYDVPLYSESKIFPAIMRGLVRVVFKLFRWKKEGFEVVEKFREEGKVAVIAANHLSFSDPVFIHLCMDFKIRFMAKSEFFDEDQGFFGRLFAQALARMGAFPVKRCTADMAAIRRGLRCLERGEFLGIFPEGSRKMKHGLEDPDTFSGVGLIASMAKVPIIPVALIGPEKIRPEGVKLIHFPKVRIVFLEPVDPADFESLPKKERFQAIADEVMRRIREVTGEKDAWSEITAKA